MIISIYLHWITSDVSIYLMSLNVSHFRNSNAYNSVIYERKHKVWVFIFLERKEQCGTKIICVFKNFWFLARLYESTGRAIAVTPASASALLKMLKFLVKVFMSLYLLKLWMDQVDTLHVGRYWFEVLCCTIMTHLGDLEVKVTDLEIFC